MRFILLSFIADTWKRRFWKGKRTCAIIRENTVLGKHKRRILTLEINNMYRVFPIWTGHNMRVYYILYVFKKTYEFNSSIQEKQCVNLPMDVQIRPILKSRLCIKIFCIVSSKSRKCHLVEQHCGHWYSCNFYFTCFKMLVELPIRLPLWNYKVNRPNSTI